MRQNIKFIVQNYFTNDVDEETTSDVTYVGQSKSTKDWLVQKIDESSDPITIRYANIKNNLTKTTYDTAWTDRVNLTYAKMDAMEFE